MVILKELRSDRKDDYYNYRLRELRLAAGYTERALGNEVGVSNISINCYERLRTWPSPEVAQSIAGALSARLGRQVYVGEVFPEWLRPVASEVRAERRKALGSQGVCVSLEDVPEEELAEENGILDELTRKELREKVREVVGLLVPHEREVIVRRYGLGEMKPQGLVEIGVLFGVSSERVRQIEVRAVEKLRYPSRSKYLVGFVECA